MNDYLQIFVVVVTLAVAGYAIYAATQQGKPVTLAGVVEEVKDAIPVALQAKEIVQIAVDSTEQLKREGMLKDNDEAFNHALNLAKQWLPPEWQVSNEDVVSFINAAVLVSSALARQAGVSSEDSMKKAGVTSVYGKAGTATGQ